MTRNLVHLSSLSVGARFTTESGRAGVLLSCNELRARVRWEARPARDADPAEAAHELDIAPRTELSQIDTLRNPSEGAHIGTPSDKARA